ncbi:GldG family protein [Patescibacteria group bacterium]|nr:GldG family protein [Patescibacteria group bacterium]MBU4512257.1 GldG family protein [Patescibacteria group bacterium]MCG2692933.1 GldG family protein [Candidatus Parcubacteria bacterium]
MKFSTQQRTNVIIATLIFMGILIVVNILSYQLFHRFDLTGENEFSISKSTKRILKDLDDIVTMKAYFSEELPAELMLLRQEVSDTFDEYKNYSGGKLKVEYVDPAEDTELEQEVQMIGIPQLQFNIRSKDKFELRNGYLGLAIMYEDRKEIIPVIQSTRNLEYDLTSAIKKVIRSEEIKIGILTGRGIWDLQQEMTVVGQSLGKQYEVEEVSITSGELIAPEITTLIIPSPKEEFTDRELYVIDQFLMNGGNLFVALDNVVVDNNLQTKPVSTGLEKLLKHYGLGLEQSLVLDVSAEMVSFSSGFVQFFSPYPYWPKITPAGFNSESVITSKLEALVLPWAGNIKIDSGKLGNEQVIILAQTTNRSWKADYPPNLNPQQDFSPPSEGQPYPVAVLVSGKLESFYKGKEIPQKEMSEAAVEAVSEELKGSTDNARIVLVADGDFMHDNFIRRFPDDGVFFENVVDYLSLGEDLIGIRSRGVTDRTLQEISSSKRNAIKYGNIFGVTCIVVLFGMVRFWSRRKKRFADEL